MKGLDATFLNSPIDVLFELARDLKNDPMYSPIHTISIGDGGNEIGMGNILSWIKKHIPLGELIGCVIQCDFLITSGVSNWGGYALASSLFIISFHYLSSTESEKLIRMLPNPIKESNYLDLMLSNGAIDGVTCKAERLIDGMEFELHEKLINQINQIVNNTCN